MDTHIVRHLITSLFFYVILASSGAKADTIDFAERLQQTDPLKSGNVIQVNQLSTSAVQFSGDAFMQYASENLGGTPTLHLGNDYSFLDPQSQTHILTMTFASPIANAAINYYASPDFIDYVYANAYDGLVLPNTPSETSIELFDSNGMAVGQINDYIGGTISGSSPFTKLVMTYTEGIALLESGDTSDNCIFLGICSATFTPTALMGHVEDMIYSPIPEPATWLLLMAGVVFLARQKSKLVILNQSLA